jgi:RND family efflux transporter MFP subunit
MMAARAALLSHGLSKRDLKRLEQGRDFGRLILRAPIDGVIVNDQAVLGQFVRPGTLLMRIADESTMWVEAHVPPEQLPKIVVGADAWVNIKGSDERLPAKIVTIHHELDPATRTAVVRLQADNRDHRLYPGMFVEVGLQGGKRTLALLLPASAVQRQGTEQIVFVERSPNVYERREVEATPATPELMRIRSGLKSGERVVTRGAFALLSELLKSGFEAHQH